MRLRRAVLAILAGASVLLLTLWIRRGARPAPAPALAPPPARTTNIPPGERRAERAIRPTSVAEAALPASAYAPIIDMPAPPPPEQGSGDDFIESGLPRALFDEKVALEAEAPSEAKLDAFEVTMGRKIDAETREAVTAVFLRQDDAAGSAIGYYRLHQVSEQEARKQIERARDRYEVDAARALGVSREAFARAFGAPR